MPCAALNGALTPVSEVPTVCVSVTPISFDASESQVENSIRSCGLFPSFLSRTITGHWTLDLDGGKTKISPEAKTVSCENTITVSHDELPLM